MDSKIDLQEILKATGAVAALITDLDGNVVEFANVDYEKNIAAMTEMAFSMCRDLSADLGHGELEQLFAKSSDGIFVANKLKTNHIIIVMSKDSSKLGLFLKLMSSMTK